MVKLLELLTFTLYIRLLVEAYQIMMISSLNEIKEFDNKSKERIISLSFAFALLMICLGLLLLMVIEWIRSRDPDVFEEQLYFKEFFGGLKDKFRSRSYMLLNFSRRGVFIALVTFRVVNEIGTI